MTSLAGAGRVLDSADQLTAAHRPNSARLPPLQLKSDRSEHGMLICLLLLGRLCKAKNIYYLVLYRKGFPGGSAIKNPPAMQQTQVRSLGWEDALHSSILAWRISWMEEPGRLQSKGSQRVRLSMHTHLYRKTVLIPGLLPVI